MKKIVFATALLISSLLFTSCENEVVRSSQDEYEQLVAEVKKESESTFHQEMHNYFGDNEYTISYNSPTESYVKKR